MMAYQQCTTFLDELSLGEKTDCGISLFRSFIPNTDAALAAVDSPEFPWETKPVLFGQQLPQHSYLYERSKKQLSRHIEAYPALEVLDDLCSALESKFDVQISTVYCNRFRDPHHHIPWHTDTYGTHIFVLSLGSTRRVEFRDKKKKKSVVSVLQPQAGDLYFMPLWINDTYEHRVVAAATEESGVRVSFVFFCRPPAYAKEYQISVGDKLTGIWTTLRGG